MSATAVLGGIVAGTELIKLGVQLVNDLSANPDMTKEQVDQAVAATQAKARMTVDGWRSARRRDDGATN
jgi:uncharacterized protein (UPF0264 family)